MEFTKRFLIVMAMLVAMSSTAQAQETKKMSAEIGRLSKVLFHQAGNMVSHHEVFPSGCKQPDMEWATDKNGDKFLFFVPQSPGTY